jgi:hypothetical protein
MLEWASHVQTISRVALTAVSMWAVAAPRPKVAARWDASRALAKIVQKNWQDDDVDSQVAHLHTWGKPSCINEFTGSAKSSALSSDEQISLGPNRERIVT